MRKLVTVSVPQEKLSILNDLKTIAKREAGSKGFSQTAIKAWADYTIRHGEGNPNMKIETYLPTAQKSPMRVFCLNLVGATTEGKVYCRKAGQSVRTSGGAWILGVTCYSCKDNQLRKEKQK